ncbi:MAG: host attachment protein [Gammaproteobacteria bacterium]|nr:MAG: host attachment protein [Gammaproteobacteria bacterium]
MPADCIIVADSARARFFLLRRPEYPELESGPDLMEWRDLVNPEAESHGAERWSEARAGANRGGNGGVHAYDDHRRSHLAMSEKRFARNIAQEAARLVREGGAREFVVVAQQRTLGLLREALGAVLDGQVRIRQLAKDLSRLEPRQIHAHLARERLVPRRRPPRGALH